MKEILEELLQEGQSYNFRNNSYSNSLGSYTTATDEFLSWIARVEDFIIRYFGKDCAPFRLYAQFDKMYLDGFQERDFNKQHSILLAALKSCSKILPNDKIIEPNKENLLNGLFDKFHLVVKQLRTRFDHRSTLDVEDEYDVQDLLHCLLKLYFNDIRKEEWTPSYAGGSSRMDFLLKEEKVVLEVKKTRQGLGDKELGKQLIEDKEKYRIHPDCKKLICFVYDPDGRITNPTGLVNDLNKTEENFKVEIIIKP